MRTVSRLFVPVAIRGRVEESHPWAAPKLFDDFFCYDMSGI